MVAAGERPLRSPHRPGIHPPSHNRLTGRGNGPLPQRPHDTAHGREQRLHLLSKDVAHVCDLRTGRNDVIQRNVAVDNSPSSAATATNPVTTYCVDGMVGVPSISP